MSVLRTDREVALDYLRTPPGAPWRWEDGGRTLVWRDGTTLLFREELALIAEHLTPGSLPPMATLVCVLAACRGRYLEFPATAVAGATAGQAARLAMGATLTQRAEQLAQEQLRKLAALPADLIAQPRGKALLAQILWEATTERGGGVGSADAARVAAGLQRGLSERELNATLPDAAPLDVAGTLHRAAQPLRGHTAETLRLRLRTGLDALPGAGPALVLPRGERARRLLARLAENEEQRGLALVVRDLMAAIRLPSLLARADEDAAGGAAGLVNRGTLDRLLLSELAHDDLTLATRVALNEALYLHREPPAQRPQRGLALLLDAGLRMWGAPRVLGAATGLALLAGWPDAATAGVWRADDDRATAVDLLEAKVLAEHLAVLGLALHPGRAWPGFWAQAAAGGETDVVVVTHRDALRSAAWRQQLAQVELERSFMVLLDGEGLVQLYALPWVGDGARPLAEVQADVAKLWSSGQLAGAKAPPGPPPLDPLASLDLPAIFRVKPFPLLLPVTGKLDRTERWGQGGLALTTDKRLYHWARSDHGARMVLADLPGGQTAYLHGGDDGWITVVRGRDGSGKMSVLGIGPDGAAPNITRLNGPQVPMAVSVQSTALLLVLHTRVAAVARDASRVLAETPIPERLQLRGGRYFVDAEELWFCAWDGAQVRWDKTGMSKHVKPADILWAFDRAGVGPWVVTRDRRILSPGGVEWMRLGSDPVAVTVRQQGEELLINAKSPKGNVSFLVDLKARQARQLREEQMASNEVSHMKPPSRPLLCRITAVHAAPGQTLRLRNQKGHWQEVSLQQDGLRLVEASKYGRSYDAEARQFAQMITPLALGCGLKRATWPDGSVAWLDDRGLLHLRSSHRDLPELTLALNLGGKLAVWTSEGRVAGPEFFTGQKSDFAGTEVLNLLSRFANALC